MAAINTVDQAVAMFVARHDPRNPMGTWNQVQRLEQMARDGQDAAPFTAAQLGEIAEGIRSALIAQTDQADAERMAAQPAAPAMPPAYAVYVDGQMVAGSAQRDTAVTLYNATVWDMMVRQGARTIVRLIAGAEEISRYPADGMTR